MYALYKGVENMPYKKLLKDLIEKNNFTNKYIAEECKKLGVPMDASYISKLINENEDVVASEQKNEALAQVLGVHKNLLNIEAFLDKAPAEIKNFINMLRVELSKTMLVCFKNTVPPETFSELEKRFETIPLAEFIIQTLPLKDLISTFKVEDLLVENFKFADNNVFQMQLATPPGFPVEDNAMEPLIYKGSTVILEILENYKNGDILCVKVKNCEKFLIRTCIFSGNKVILQPFNLVDFKPEEYNKKDVTILGKVKQVTKELY